jgi:surface protein
MKTTLRILLLVLVPYFGMSQTIEKFSIDSGGATVSQGDIQLLQSIGEVNIQELSAGDIQVSEGFINPTREAASTDLFITKWVVTAGQTITIPTRGTGYDYDVDWSYDAVDGFIADSMNQTGNATSPVLAAGEHVVAITGNFPRIYFNQTGDKNKITEIVQWGTNLWTSMNRAFAGCPNLNIVNPAAGAPDLSSVTDMSRMFYNGNSFNADIGNWDVSNVENMDSMFFFARIFNQDLSGWDTSNVTNMTRMFYRADLFNQNLGDWDISSVVNMGLMLFGAQLSVNNYDNTLIGWATDSSGVAGDGIDDIPTNVLFDGGTSMYCNGEAARNLLTAALPVPGGYGWTITDAGLDCSATLFITKWVVLDGETITIPTLGFGYDYNVDWSYDALDGFNADSMNQTGDATSPVLAAGEHIVAINGDFPHIFFNTSADSKKITEIVQWGTNPWTSMRHAFEGCSNLNIINPMAGVPNLASVTTMKRMFFNATSFNASLANWDVSNVIDVKAMFRNAYAFDQDLGSWDIGNMNDMEIMFLNTGLSIDNYDNTLIGWAADSSGNPGDGIDDIPTNITFDGGSSRYCAGETARNLLTAALPTPTGYGWTITDGGLDCGGGDALFITKWEVLSGETITIPTFGGGYDYDVDWSYDAIDGFNAESMNISGDATSPSLTAGEHIVAITGDFPRIFFERSPERNKITEIVQWGTNPWKSMKGAFAGCANFNIVNPAAGAPNLSLVTNMYAMFSHAGSFNGDLSSWDVSNVENMDTMFFYARIFNQDLSNWDTSNVTNMSRMFYRADLFDQNLGAWDIGNVTTMENMFFNVTLSTNNYDNTLISWTTDSSGIDGDDLDDIPNSITFNGGNSEYCAGEASRDLLTAALPTPTGYGWTITDGGLICDGLLEIIQSNLESVSVYPNPTRNIVTIVSPQIMLTSATVYDIQGRKVSEVDFRNQTIYQIDLSDMEAAVYFINIATEKGTVTKRVIKHE